VRIICRRSRVDGGVGHGCVALDIDSSFRAYMFFPGRDHRIFVQYAEEKTNVEVLAVLFPPDPSPYICVIVVVRCGEHTLSPSSWTDSLHPSTSEAAVTPPCTKHCASTTAGDVPVTSLLAMSLMR
jgi:hypothetical protein